MGAIWGRMFIVLAALAAAGLVVWAFAGATAALALVTLGMGCIVLSHTWYLSVLNRWLRNPVPDAVPEARGAWEQVFADLYRLLRRQYQSESQLTATLQDFQQASAAMPDGMVILDRQDRIEWCNPKAEAHFGLDRAHDAGQAITHLVRQPEFSGYLQAQSHAEPLILRQSRGVDATLAVQLVPYGNQQKLVISRDITHLERVETMRSDFIANVSHELRTPLTVLCGFLETMSDSEAPDAGLLRRSLPLMMDQARRMQWLVEDLLTLSRLESSQNMLREEPVEVSRLVHALHDDAAALSAGRHSILLGRVAADWLMGSEEELRSAFSNLVSNAVRYTPEGGEITISWERRDGVAAFSVQDTGIGVAPQDVPRITERFYRVDRSRSRETGGTGLGLAIVKHVLQRHQAQLEVTSELGRGSVFSAVFPAERLLEAPQGERVARAG
jgi:two-component system, OmpR family, phosphate regulon sensor histidine kinase PhoR